MDDIDTTNPIDQLYPDAFSEEYKQAEEHLPNLTDFDLGGLAGALVAEYVNRGNDTETALAKVIESAKAGAEGSRIFDQMMP